MRASAELAITRPGFEVATIKPQFHERQYEFCVNTDLDLLIARSVTLVRSLLLALGWLAAWLLHDARLPAAAADG